MTDNCPRCAAALTETTDLESMDPAALRTYIWLLWQQRAEQGKRIRELEADVKELREAQR